MPSFHSCDYTSENTHTHTHTHTRTHAHVYAIYDVRQSRIEAAAETKQVTSGTVSCSTSHSLIDSIHLPVHIRAFMHICMHTCIHAYIHANILCKGAYTCAYHTQTRARTHTQRGVGSSIDGGTEHIEKWACRGDDDLILGL
jgi:hypothetical protein